MRVRQSNKSHGGLYACATLMLAPLLVSCHALPSQSAHSRTPTGVYPSEVAGRTQLPMAFQPNLGQTDPSVHFLSHLSAGTLFFTSGEVVMSLTEAVCRGEEVVRIRFIGANSAVQLTQSEALQGRVNYFIGNDPSQWRTNVPSYEHMTYKDIYAGVDLNYSGNVNNLKGTYVVAPGADPAQIHWRYDGAIETTLNSTGDLQVSLQASTLIEHAPVAWQEIQGKRVDVSASYVIEANANIGFLLGQYDSAYPLTLDPTITYSTYFGGSSRIVNSQPVSDSASSISVDSEGNTYLVGTAGSTNFPTKNPLQPNNKDRYDMFVAKLNPAGNGLIYSTYLGGTSNDFGAAIAVDSDGSAFATGSTNSQNFPLAPNPFQATSHGDSDAFVVKLNPAGSTLLYSTYLGGSGYDAGGDIAVDNLDYAIITGYTFSANFPVRNAYQSSSRGGGDVFVTRIEKAGGGLVFSTYLGGNGYDVGSSIAVDNGGKAYLTGLTRSSNFPTLNAPQRTFGGGQQDAFVTELSPSGNALVYSTYLGGYNSDNGSSIAVGRAGNAFVTGSTDSPNFPTSNNAYQATSPGAGNAFVAEVADGGVALLYSTFLGGNNADIGDAIAMDPADNAYVAGSTKSTNFPLLNSVQPSIAGDSDVFITKLGHGLVPAYSTLLGGSNADAASDIAVDDEGSAYIIGNTTSANFPLVSALQSTQTSMFIAKLLEPLPLPPTSTGGGRSTPGVILPTRPPNTTPIPTISPPVPLPGTGSRFFPQTGKTVRGLFLQYWDTHGGLAQQGYPISDLFGEISDLDGKSYTVQYFERAVFEYHPENPAPFNVLLSQLGTFQYAKKYPAGAPNQTQHKTNGQFFPQTGHWVGGRFLKYWNEHGALSQQGYPLSDEFTEVSDVDGKPYTVQYFERAVFELHTENQPPNDVLLSLLGVLRFAEKYGPH
jgi:hypothetical protein